MSLAVLSASTALKSEPAYNRYMPFYSAAVCNYNLKIAIVILIIGMDMYCVSCSLDISKDSYLYSA